MCAYPQSLPMVEIPHPFPFKGALAVEPNKNLTVINWTTLKVLRLHKATSFEGELWILLKSCKNLTSYATTFKNISEDSNILLFQESIDDISPCLCFREEIIRESVCNKLTKSKWQPINAEPNFASTVAAQSACCTVC